MRRSPTAINTLLLVLLLLLAQGARAVQLYYGLDDLRDLEMVEIVDGEGIVQKHTLLAFSNHACKEHDSYVEGFPFNYMHLPGEGFELGQVGSWALLGLVRGLPVVEESPVPALPS